MSGTFQIDDRRAGKHSAVVTTIQPLRADGCQAGTIVPFYGQLTSFHFLVQVPDLDQWDGDITERRAVVELGVSVRTLRLVLDATGRALPVTDRRLQDDLTHETMHLHLVVAPLNMNSAVLGSVVDPLEEVGAVPSPFSVFTQLMVSDAAEKS